MVPSNGSKAESLMPIAWMRWKDAEKQIRFNWNVGRIDRVDVFWHNNTDDDNIRNIFSKANRNNWQRKSQTWNTMYIFYHIIAVKGSKNVAG